MYAIANQFCLCVLARWTTVYCCLLYHLYCIVGWQQKPPAALLLRVSDKTVSILHGLQQLCCSCGVNCNEGSAVQHVVTLPTEKRREYPHNNSWMAVRVTMFTFSAKSVLFTGVLCILPAHLQQRIITEVH